MKKLSLLTIVLLVAAFALNVNAQPRFSTVEFVLEWDVASTANTAQFRAEHYSVWISTSGTSPDDFTMVFDETLSTTEPNWIYQPREVDITSFGGSIIHVAFRHHDITDMDRIVIDNVKITMRDLSRNGMEEVLLFEDFQEAVEPDWDEEWLPEGWTKLDADGDDFNWYFGVRNDVEGAMRSQSWGGSAVGPLTPDNWLITPAVHLEFVGLNENNTLVFSMFPNPAVAVVNIKAAANIQQITITDLRGRVVYNQTLNSSQLQIETGDFEAGIYLVQMQTEKGLVNTKLQVVR